MISSSAHVFSIVVYMLLLLCFWTLGATDPISQMQKYSEIYKYSHTIMFGHNDGTPSTNEMAYWWSANVTTNTLYMAVVSSQVGWVGVAFNSEKSITMTGVGVLGNSGSVGLYNLMQDSGANPVDSSPLKYTSYTVIDGFGFMEIIWDLNIGNSAFNFSVSDKLSVLWATCSSPDITQWHDYRRTGVVNLNLVTGDNAVKFSACNCIGNQIPNPTSTVYACPCNCVGYFQPPSCVSSNLTYSYTFLDMQTPISTIYWNVFGNIVHFDVQSSGESPWGGIGFTNTSIGRMVGADAVIFGQGLGVSARRIISKSSEGLVPMQALNITSTTLWKLRDGRYGMHFARNLNDGVNQLGDGSKVYMVAVCNTKSAFPSLHNVYSKGAVSVNLITGIVDPPTFIWSNEATHGVLMYIAWGILIPFGYVWARYAKHLPDALWFEGHRLVMTVGFLTCLSGAALAFAMVSDNHFGTLWHAQLGIAVIAAMLYQVCSGILKPHLDAKRGKTKRRMFFEVTHHIIGRLAILGAWATIYGGLLILPNVPPMFLYIHAALMALWVIISGILELRSHLRKNKQKYELVDNTSKTPKPKSLKT